MKPIGQCAICSSDLAAEINQKRRWRPDRLQFWANRRGLAVTMEQLDEHLRHHLDHQRAPASKSKNHSAQSELTPSPSSPQAAQTTDEQFLNRVIAIVNEGLSSGSCEPKIEHAFKAIELKLRLAENGNVETLLLELLDEIRRQELAHTDAKGLSKIA